MAAEGWPDKNPLQQFLLYYMQDTSLVLSCFNQIFEKKVFKRTITYTELKISAFPIFSHSQVIFPFHRTQKNDGDDDNNRNTCMYITNES